MRARAAMTLIAIGAALAAPAVTTADTRNEACHGKGRIVDAHDVGGTIIYTDDRGYLSHDTVPDEAHDAYNQVPRDVRSTLGYTNRIPLVAVNDDNGGYWIYMEANGHKGLQTGGEHAVLGGNDSSAIDPCRSTHGVKRGYDTILF